jgi:predicted phosphodiesterase
MRSLVLSDIHGNIEALEAVLRDANGLYDEIVCCGDLVGYGANPRDVIEWAREAVSRTVRGNHDRAAWDPEVRETFNPSARAAIDWCDHELEPSDLEWLRALPAGPLWSEGFGLAHGSPADEDEYVLSVNDVWGLDDTFVETLCFIGHTHIQGGWTWQREGLRNLPVPVGRERHRTIEIHRDEFYLVNPGSVGQPRDHDPRAGYALLDRDRNLLTFRRVPDRISGAQERILSAGLPEYLAYRLAEGR